MSESEADACAAMLAGENVPLVEICSNLSVLETLQIESEGRSVWGHAQDVDVDSHAESVRLFVCLVVDAICRDCNFISVRRLWDLMVTADSQHASLFGSACRVGDILVFIILFKMCYMLDCMLQIELCFESYQLRFFNFLTFCVHVVFVKKLLDSESKIVL